MEIRSPQREKGPVLAAVLALAVLGAGSLFLTWQGIARQRAIVEEHMILSARAVVRGVEANLIRSMRSFRNDPRLPAMFPSLAQDLFRELASSSEDILFVSLYDANGAVIVSSLPDGPQFQDVLPPEARETVDAGGVFEAVGEFGGKKAVVTAVRARPSLAMACQGMEPGPRPGPGARFGKGMGPGFMGPPPDRPAVFLVVALDAGRYLAQFDQYRRAALLQAGYVFLAAIVLWALAFAYLRRRDQAQRLMRLERFQSKLLDNMPDGLVTLAADGEILAANGSADFLLAGEGRQEGPLELVGRNWKDFPFTDLRGSHEWKQHEFGGRSLEMLCVPVQDEAEPASGQGQRLVLIRDRTTIRGLEEDLNEARRLAAIGSLAAGVAHEVRNPLSALRGFAQFFADKLAGSEPFASYAATMVQESDRLNRVVTDLLFLAKPRELAPVEIDLAETVDGLSRLLRFDLEHKRVALELALEASTVRADPDALKQALLNLLVNSLHAVAEQGGRIRLSSARGDDGQGTAGVWLGVSDNGPGMPEEVRQHALEPFYTAKKQGTGLGLAIVQAILRGHRGRVLIESAEGAGTTVRLFFPDQAPGEEPGPDLAQ